MSANAIDLTTLQDVADWIAPYTVAANATEDKQIQDAITAFSAYALKATSRGPADGSIPTASPFVAVVPYDECYDGTGTWRMQLRNWPIVSIVALTINGVAARQSTAVQVPGWVIDQDKRFLSIRGGAGGNVATFQNYGFQGLRGGGIAGIAPGGFSKGIQNVEVQYTAGFSGVPFDLEMVARKVVALNYKRRSWIGQQMQAMAAGAGTTSFGQWEMDVDCRNVLHYYKAMIS